MHGEDACEERCVDEVYVSAGKSVERLLGECARGLGLEDML